MFRKCKHCIKLLMEFFKEEKVHQPKGNLNSAKIWAYVIKASCLFHFFSLQSLGLFQPLLNCGFSRITFRIYLLWVLFSFLTWIIIDMQLISIAFNQISLIHLWEQNTEKNIWQMIHFQKYFPSKNPSLCQPSETDVTKRF